MSNETQAPVAPAQSSWVRGQIKSLLSGGFGGACLVFVGHPFDLMKVRLQTSNEYKGILDVFKKTASREGIRGFYKGMGAPLVGSTPVFALCFWGYDLGKSIMYKVSGTPRDEKLSITNLVIAGGLSALPATVAMTPIERVKCLLQVQDGAAVKRFSGPVDVVKTLWKEGGIKSIYKGTGATLLRDVPGSMAYFGAYELVKKAMTPAGAKPEDLNKTAVLFAGGMAGVANWAVAIPADVVKSRLQTAAEGTYSGTMDCFLKLLRSEGPTALFKGFGPIMLRAFPANAACFLGVEVSLKAMDKVF